MLHSADESKNIKSMGYSIYAKLPAYIGSKVFETLEKEFQPGATLFDPDLLDASREISKDDELAYVDDKHLNSKNTLIGFNYSCPMTPIREYLTSVVTMLARLYPEKHPKFYYDGEPVFIYDSREEGRASGKSEWIACDKLGVNIPPDKKGILSKIYAIKPKDQAKIVAEVSRLSNILKELSTDQANEPAL